MESVSIREDITITKVVKMGDELWDVYANLLLRNQDLFIRRCVGKTKDDAIMDAYKEIRKVMDGEKSARVFVKNIPEPTPDIENNPTFAPIKNTLWQKSQDQTPRSPSE